jgi:FeS assembly protein IscX
MLGWDDSYSIALELIKRFPGINLENVSLDMIFKWSVNLPEFDDDPTMENDDILLAILQEWYEEVDPI